MFVRPGVTGSAGITFVPLGEAVVRGMTTERGCPVSGRALVALMDGEGEPGTTAGAIGVGVGVGVVTGWLCGAVTGRVAGAEAGGLVKASRKRRNIISVLSGEEMADPGVAVGVGCP